jgi:hypothetical protein
VCDGALGPTESSNPFGECPSGPARCNSDGFVSGFVLFMRKDVNCFFSFEVILGFFRLLSASSALAATFSSIIWSSYGRYPQNGLFLPHNDRSGAFIFYSQTLNIYINANDLIKRDPLLAVFLKMTILPLRSGQSCDCYGTEGVDGNILLVL